MHATADAGEKARLGNAFPRLELSASSGHIQGHIYGQASTCPAR